MSNDESLKETGRCAAAVCYAMGLPHSDEPTCVSPTLRVLKIRLNDSRWSDDAARTKGLRRLAIAQLGSAGVLNDVEFAKRVATMTIRVIVPIVLRAAASRKGNASHKSKLESAALLCETDPSIENAKKAKAAADAAYAAAADAATAAAAYAAAAYAAAAADAAYATAYAAAYAADAAYAAADAAYAAADAYAAAADAAYAAAADAADAYAAAAAAADAAAAAADAADADGKRNLILSNFCEAVVQILIEMKAPGTEFLYLTDG